MGERELLENRCDTRMLAGSVFYSVKLSLPSSFGSNSTNNP